MKEEKIYQRKPKKVKNIRNSTGQGKRTLVHVFHAITGHKKEYTDKKKTKIIKTFKDMAKEDTQSHQDTSNRKSAIRKYIIHRQAPNAPPPRLGAKASRGRRAGRQVRKFKS
jgi:hypothetical protein